MITGENARVGDYPTPFTGIYGMYTLVARVKMMGHEKTAEAVKWSSGFGISKAYCQIRFEPQQARGDSPHLLTINPTGGLSALGRCLQLAVIPGLVRIFP
jgi:hypothetical protein